MRKAVPNGANRSRWMNWKPKAAILPDSAKSEPTKTTKSDLGASIFCNSPGVTPTETTESLEAVLKGQAIELWSTAAGSLFLVADQEDARLAMERFGTRRGEVYTAAEVRCIVAVADPAVVAEIHKWKREFDAVVHE